jgi:hypothetical protein
MSTSADASAAVPATTAVPTTGVSLPLVMNTTGMLSAAAPATGGQPTLHSLADTLAGITTALTSLQLQMAAVTHQLADQGARLTSLDGRPPLPQFGLPGFGGIPPLAASSTPVITDVTTAAGDSSASASSSRPLSSPVPQGSQPVALPPSTGVPITHINFPHSPSPLPTFGSVAQRLPPPTSAHMAEAQPYLPPPPEGDSAIVPKYHKITFETYDGTEDPLGWLNKCEQFFRGQLTREVDKVWMASYHL